MTIDDNGIDTSALPAGNSGDVLTWDGSQWVLVPATPLTNGVPVTISGSGTQGGTITVNGTGITIGNVVTSVGTGVINPHYITWFNPVNNVQLELDLGKPEKKENSEGCFCKKCKELYPYAIFPEDGSDFICWGCQNF